MSNYNQNQAQVAYPYPAAKTQPQAPAYTAPPPPADIPSETVNPQIPVRHPAKLRPEAMASFLASMRPCVAVKYSPPAVDDPKPQR